MQQKQQQQHKKEMEVRVSEQQKLNPKRPAPNLLMPSKEHELIDMLLIDVNVYPEG